MFSGKIILRAAKNENVEYKTFEMLQKYKYKNSHILLHKLKKSLTLINN